MTVEFTVDELDQFTCTEQYWRHPMFKGLVYTDGVQFISSKGCGWFVEMILLQNIAQEKLRNEEFQVWTLTCVDPDASAAVASAYPSRGGVGMVVVDDGNGNVLWEHTIDYTDWPAGQTLKLYVENGVILIPSER